jgi:exopolyphosphatase/guanosine-5'-triphosphate,3'-diphosphate pyrophosphatase
VDAHPGAPPLPALAVKEPTRLTELIEDRGVVLGQGVCHAVTAVEEALAAARRHRVEPLLIFGTRTFETPPIAITSPAGSKRAQVCVRSS